MAGRQIYHVCWPNGKVGLVACHSDLQLYEILDAETDITRCSVKKFDNDVCLLFDPEKKIYSEK